MKTLSFGILLCFIWAGMLLGISFLEAPIKFTAPSLTLKVGLDVGRHVFQAFNKVEIVFSLCLFLIIIIGKPSIKLILIYAIIIILFALECVWLLPILDERAVQIIAGQAPQKESPHMWYIIFDALKVILLIVSGYICFAEIKRRLKPIQIGTTSKKINL